MVLSFNIFIWQTTSVDLFLISFQFERVQKIKCFVIETLSTSEESKTVAGLVSRIANNEIVLLVLLRSRARLSRWESNSSMGLSQNAVRH